MSDFNLKTATPMMAQWHQCREKAKGALLLFRMGDFYEAFYDDAKILAEALNLTLTKRQDIPMSGIPHHAFQNYIDRLLAKGIKVAVAEQTEDPKKAKGLVKRDLVRIITPGTLIESNLLQAKAHNYIASLCQIGSKYGLALLDLTTSDFLVCEYLDLKNLSDELFRLQPSELVLPKKLFEKSSEVLENFKRSFNLTLTPLENWQFDAELSLEFLTRHFKTKTLDGFGLKGMMPAINAAGALLSYLSESLCIQIDLIKTIKKMEQKDYLLLDHITLNHLEIIQPQNPQNKNHTLLHLVDHTQTAMGGRQIREWVQKPLLNIKKIQARQDAISDYLSHPYALKDIQENLSQVEDIERLIIKVASNVSSARDFISLSNSLKKIPSLKEDLKKLASPLNQDLCEDLIFLDSLTKLIDQAIVEEPPAKLGDGRTFKKGYSKELDEYLDIGASSKEWLAKYQQELREKTEIKTLKVGYNRVFGYYIEVSKGQAHLMPSSFLRRQTLTNNERFISDELKDFETKVLSAEEKIALIENKLFENLKNEILTFQKEVLLLSKTLAHIDCVLSLALLAEESHYVKPLIDDSSVIQINQGRHPVLDKLSSFIPNDTFLDDEKNRLSIITGPNMAGKSTYIRQVALIIILAQIGSYIPAESAHLGIVEKIFSRIGASDDLARGQSTFMVEMVETANIINNLSEKSLIILDEIGRGTSTYDGIAIAQSTAEFLLKSKAKTLFATHYSELTKLSEKNEGVVNYTVAVHEEEGKITFLYKIIQGCTDKSYGIHVAELAGLPKALIQRAYTILEELEEKKKEKGPKKKVAEQLDFLFS